MAHPKILISTVYGEANCEFIDNMEAGNAVRLKDWQARWCGTDSQGARALVR